MSRAQLWDFALRHGRRSVDGACSEPAIAAGSPADLLVLDWESLDDDTLFDDVDPLDLLMARAHGGHIDSLFVGGRAVVASGRVTGIDEPALRAELLARTRAALAAEPAYAAWRATLGAMAEDLGPFYRRSAPGCC
jgi:cytosine/adenosine deaminase-related metal-dependent hydrolase